ncbi:hypothetical protein SLE2022_187710 [Rubroshorea leprosula]
MEEYPQLLNLMTQKKEEDRKLELRLGPPGEALLGCKNGPKRAFQHTVEPKNGENPSSLAFWRETQKDKQNSSPSISNKLSAMAEESSQHTDKKPNTFRERTMACAPVVGWPPIRSSRKNLTGNNNSSSKPASEPPKTLKEKKEENIERNQFVKINMEGIPIGRKVNLQAYNSYEELSVAIDQLFSGLLAVQRDSSATQDGSKIEESKTREESLAGNGEYTLVYEDDEGDRILVGDVPWDMFVSSARRLRVLKSSELS